MQNPALIKRSIISAVFLVIFVVTAFFIYYAVTPPATCTDKKQNQSEKGIDCGGPCSPCKDIAQTQDIVVTESAVALGGNNTYDAVAKITNPNDSIGASSFKYTFTLKDENGKILATREGTDFILPADSKYVAELAFETEGGVMPTQAELIISDPKWEKLSNIGKPQIGVYSKNFGSVPAGVGSEADGIIRNESGYDLNTISLVVILRSDKGGIVGINKTNKTNVRAKEERDFRLTWPYQLAAPVQNIEVDAQANVYDPGAFSYSIQ
jgi:hypothetical protein